MSRSSAKCKPIAWIAGFFLFFASLFRFDVKDSEEPRDNHVDDFDFDTVDAPSDGTPRVTYFYEDEDDHETRHIEHEIRIDLAGRIYFKIGGRWRLQDHVEEIHAFNLRTRDRMGEYSRERALRDER